MLNKADFEHLKSEKLNEADPRASRALLSQAQQVTGVGFWKYDVCKDEFYGSNEMFRIYGIDPLEGKNDFRNTIKLVHPEDQIKLQQAIEKHLAGESCEFEYRIHQPDGSLKYIIGRGEPIFDSKGLVTGVLGTVQDITEKIESQREIKHLASCDLLTNLPNRISFEKQLKRQCREAKKSKEQFALFLIDIDGLKDVNEALGNGLGDQLIIQITQKLKAFLGDTVFLSRYAGGQFSLLLPNKFNYKELAGKITGLFRNPVEIDNYEIDVTISIGISLYPGDGQNSDALLQSVYIALHQAKQKGRNHYEFHAPQKSIQSYKQFMLRNDLRRAGARAQFKVYYQPLVKLQTGEILAAEALIRWEHPLWGLVPPQEFIYLAEETGFIIEIGHWLLREVCAQYQQWLKAGLPAIKIAVNYSAVQFLENNFVDNIKKIISEFELDPHFLIIEVTESVLLKNSEKIIADIHHLRALGIQVALDDFGTGFSSLAYLSKFNIDLLKIDRSFIRNLFEKKTCKIITAFIINLARELGIKLVAEGIETQDQLLFLRQLNCYSGQGYLYSKAVSPQEFEKILAKKSCRPVENKEFDKKTFVERRKYFRITFPQLLEAEVTIIKISGQEVETGCTKVVVKDMGPGGLCFNANIRFPLDRDIILKFMTELLGEEIRVFGRIVWMKEVDEQLYEYGIEFTFDENDRMNLTKLLNQVQIKLRNIDDFVDGAFVAATPKSYFQMPNLQQ